MTSAVLCVWMLGSSHLTFVVLSFVHTVMAKSKKGAKKGSKRQAPQMMCPPWMFAGPHPPANESSSSEDENEPGPVSDPAAAASGGPGQGQVHSADALTPISRSCTFSSNLVVPN